MAHQRPDETKQPPPPPSTQASPTTTTTSSTYLSTHLIVSYFINAQGEIKRPEHLIAWWTRIFSFYVPNEIDCIQLRFLCRLFRDALQPPPLYTTFPHPNYTSFNLASFMDHLDHRQNLNNTVPTIIFISKGVHNHIHKNAKASTKYIKIEYPMTIIGAGKDLTIVKGAGFQIFGKKGGGVVTLKSMTITHTRDDGVYGEDGLSFQCVNMKITHCRYYGVGAYKTSGRLFNCVITKCGLSGVLSSSKALIEIAGSETKVDGNGTKKMTGNYGLHTSNTPPGAIHLLLPLTKESVARNNCNGKNWGGSGVILEVAAFGM